MGIIKKLADTVIDQIAAGEVVERPANVVKELVENSIDAGATDIEIRLSEGGHAQIRIKDNGFGMDQEDLLNCVDRHATSKVSEINDLFQLNTMGFRGEALSSIASVSDFTIKSQKKNTPSGYQLTIVDNNKEISQWNGHQGTIVSVNNLFKNIPARKKFLKKPQAEYAACLEIITAISLASYSIAISLFHNEKLIFQLDQGSFKKRVVDLLKNKLNSTSLIKIEKSSSFCKMEGYISPPGLERGTSRDLYIFVNGRYIKDQKIRYAILRGYHSYILKGRFPLVVISLEIQPSLLDVNVSPSKTEIRLQYSDEILNLISSGIKESLREGSWADVEASDKPMFQNPSTYVEESIPVPLKNVSKKPASKPPFENELQSILGEGVSIKSQRFEGNSPNFGSEGRGLETHSLKRPSFIATDLSFESDLENISVEKVSKEVFYGKEDSIEMEKSNNFSFDKMTYGGVLFKCFLIYEEESRVLFIDQHAFHERILYEKLIERHESLLDPQPLLIVESINLNESEINTLVEHKDQIFKNGFEFSVIGSDTLEIIAVPTLLHSKDLSLVFQDLSNKLNQSYQIESKDLSKEILHNIYSTISCHSAIRAGELLTEEERKILENEASDVDFYFNCPHGRRVFKWIPKKELEGWFDRS